MSFVTNPAPQGCPVADVQDFFGTFGVRRYPVVRITVKYYILRYSARAVGRFHRQIGGSQAGQEVGDISAPSSISNTDVLEDFAAHHGGTWDSGWKAWRN